MFCPKMAHISIIIPVFNEATTIQKTLLRLKDELDTEIIVVDGGSSDKTVELVQELDIKVIVSSCLGRAYQMNLGATLATEKILLFLHADTILPKDYQTYIEKTLSYSQVIAGAFELKIDGEQKGLRWVEKWVNLRSHFLSLPYGDQAIFLNAATFRDMGGFANLPIMEDFEFIQRLKQQGKIAIVPASVLTSRRRWQKLGIIKTTLINQLIILGYYLKVPPTILARLYGRKVHQ